MAMTGLLALLDDISTVLDDVAVLSKVAAKKTAGVLGDDLALNAEQVSGVRAQREIPVVWAVAKGSFLNKLILVPAALLIGVIFPALITPLLMLGGLFLCFEGVEKVLHKFLHSKEEETLAHKKKLRRLADKNADLVKLEKDKIKGAIRTDFILSAEIIVIVLGVVKDATVLTQIFVVSSVALFVTIVVYSLVAGIVKLDDLGLHLIKSENSGAVRKAIGKYILLFAPWLMKGLSFFGTLAMFLVGGGIIVHALPFLHHTLHDIKHAVEHMSAFIIFVIEPLTSAIVGIVMGAIVLTLVSAVQKLRGIVATN
ncbi:MAG: DUF808 domain-containing protein [Agarilytica sp.]